MDCYTLEQELHLKYDKERISQNREWFALSENQVADVILKFTEVQIGVDNLLPDVSIEYRLYANMNDKSVFTLDEFKVAMLDYEYKTYEEALFYAKKARDKRRDEKDEINRIAIEYQQRLWMKQEDQKQKKLQK